jgi:uncharacterized membrane protein
MTRGRLEAFSDGVIAIIITIMVLELRPPDGVSLEVIRPLAPKMCGYVLSFVFVAIYWNNHHHLMHVVERINGKVLWANMHLLFWLSLVPVVTAWMGDQRAAPLTVAVYGAVLLLSGVAYFILARALLAIHAPDSHLAKALGRDWKGKVSVVVCGVAIPVAFVERWISIALYVTVALTWLVPDTRIERTLGGTEG